MAFSASLLMKMPCLWNIMRGLWHACNVGLAESSLMDRRRGERKYCPDIFSTIPIFERIFKEDLSKYSELSPYSTEYSKKRYPNILNYPHIPKNIQRNTIQIFWTIPIFNRTFKETISKYSELSPYSKEYSKKHYPNILNYQEYTPYQKHRHRQGWILFSE